MSTPIGIQKTPTAKKVKKYIRLNVSVEKLYGYFLKGTSKAPGISSEYVYPSIMDIDKKRSR